ncbi:hypothetical protein L618_001300001150 [Rhodococcus rhodochrous J45]|uniref:Uncharacterized protein n=2 Tax=Rhodococcus rhodochrous TaxID=1829 RepID=A0A562EMP7_RHORH|nr:hypothetical protein L618_001300001150 [Rhodococcus rhodochrous J45]
MAVHGMGKLLLCTAVAVAIASASVSTAHAQDATVTYTQSTILTLTGGERARDVAVDDHGNTMVLVGLRTGGARITHIGADGTSWGVAVPARGGGNGIALANDGTIFYTSGSSLSGTGVGPGSVTRIAPGGGSEQVLHNVFNPCDVATYETEFVVLDCGTGNGDAQVIRADIVSGSSIQAVAGLVQPRSVDLDQDGNILVAEAGIGDGNSTLVTVARDGTRTDIAVPGFDPLGVAAAADGTPVLAGAAGNTPQVIRLAADGTRTVVSVAGLVYSTGVAVDPSDAITVSYLEGSSTTSASHVVRLVPNPVPEPEPEPVPQPAPGFGSSGSSG